MAYSFDATRGETADAIKRRREWVQALLNGVGTGAVPTTVGGGIAEIGDALAGRVAKKRSEKMDREGTAAAMKAAGGNSYIRDLLLGNTGGGAEISGTGGANTLSGSAGRDSLAKPFKVSDPVAEDLAPHQKAFLNAISGGESGGAYNVRYTPRGPAYFNDLSRHPGIMEPGPHGKTSASGRYQFTKTTWDGLGGGDFSPANQDRMAWRLAQRDYSARTGRNLDADLQAGGLTPQIMQALTPTWQAFKGNRGRHAATYRDSLGRYSQAPAGADSLPGGEANDMLMDGWGQPDPNRPGHGINTQTGAPASFSQPDPARYGPTTAPTADRLPQPNAMPQFNPMMAQGPLGPQSLPPDRPMPSGPIPQMAQGMPPQAPTPQPRPQMAPQVDPMQTAAISQPMRPRGIVSPRAEDNGYVRGPGAAVQQPGGQGGGLLARLLMRQPMPAQGQPMSGTGGAATAPGGGNDEMMQMYALLDNPYLPESYRAALIEALKQKQQQADPAYQADLRYKEAQTRALEAPKPVENYRTLTDAEEKQYGLDPANAYQIGDDNKISQIGGGGVNVNVGDYKVPAGYMPKDPNNPNAGVVPIPGGPAEAITPELAARMGLAQGFIENFPKIEAAVKNGDLTGPVDHGMASQGWGSAGEIRRQIQTGQDALRRMLTGAGMPVAEADEYVNRYLPTWRDRAEDALSKLRGLKYDLEHAAEIVGKGRGGNPIATPNSGNEDPLGIR